MGIISQDEPYYFYRNGYEPFIDFLKGYFILCILFTHSCDAWPSLLNYSLYYVWACAPTGCFLLISTLHLYKNGLEGVNYSLVRHFKKVIVPFLILQLIVIIGVLLIKSIGYYDTDRVISLIKSGGYGVGSYFPWVYIQYIMLMLLLTPLMRRLGNKWNLFVFFVILSATIEFLCSVFSFDDDWYRITVLRFPYFIFLGYILNKEGLYLSKIRIFVSLLGLVFIILFTYTNVNLEPLFFNTSWKAYHWICYPYLAYLLFYLLFRLYRKSQKSKFSKFIMRIGKASYGIFLFQSIWFMLPICKNKSIIVVLLYIMFSIPFCTFGGVMLKEKVLDRFF